MASVSIDNVKKRYGAVEAIRGVSVDIADGEFVTLVGPSGCGKSTLLRMVAGLENITDGEIRIGARAVNDVAPKLRDIAMVFQNYALYPHMTVRQNMGFSLRLKKAGSAEMNEKVTRAAKTLSLENLLDRYPRELSGGQRQRVAMGRALVRDPQVFLLDEPLSNLDAKLRVQMRTEIKALQQQLRTTTIYVTHDQVEAMTMADKIVVMRDGIIEQMGSPLDLYDQPVNWFVAQFIGSPAMNIVDGRIEAGRFVGKDVVLSLPQAAQWDGRTVALGIRPEHLQITEDGEIAGQVEVIEPTGSETIVFVKAGAEPFAVSLRDRVYARPGDMVRLSPFPDRLHLFDAQSGDRLALADEAAGRGAIQ